MAKKIHIETYGCQMNDYESDRTYRRFHDEKGYLWTDDPTEADLVIYNTCSIRDKADQKAFSSLGRLRVAKQSRPEMVIAVGGCMAQSQGEVIQDRADYVDVVFGTHQWEKLPDIVERAAQERAKSVEIDFYGWRNYSFLPYRESKLSHPVSEMVTIQNGCDKFCTFCLVPFTRGREVSRPPKEILLEVESLVEKGVKEITLLGQNVNAYGRDRSGEISFGELLQLICDVDGLERLRFITSHPAEFSPELTDIMAETPQIARHLHLPLQSGSDTILKRMNRKHTLSEYREKASYLRKRIPDLALTTDLIVGFPSETEADFSQTLDALAEFRFDQSFSFCYSPRPHTKAAEWSKDFIDSDVAQERLVRLQTMQKEIHEEVGETYVGRTMDVLVEGGARNGVGDISGRTTTNRVVNFPGNHDLIGSIIPVRITRALRNSLRGEVDRVR